MPTHSRAQEDVPPEMLVQRHENSLFSGGPDEQGLVTGLRAELSSLEDIVSVLPEPLGESRIDPGCALRSGGGFDALAEQGAVSARARTGGTIH